jgi:putative nucleotidyltransferase with HDIG domain
MNNGKVLLVDDNQIVRETISATLEMYGHEAVAVSGGRKALDVVQGDFDVIVLDIDMPGMDGFETLQALNELKLEIPVLFLTGAGSLENAVKAINLGAYDFMTKPVEDLDLFDAKIRQAVEKRMYVLRERAYKANLEKEVKAKTRELAEKNKLLTEYSHRLENSTVNTILTLLTAMEEKDEYTAGHTERVTKYALLIGQELELPEEDRKVLERAAQLHDIGKLVIDNSSIEKAGPLDKGEWGWLKKHPDVGGNIVKPLGFLEREEQIIRHHHERMDGRGYPLKRDGRDLDLLTKIITVADSFDAMTSKRCYKKNMSVGEAQKELRRCVNSQFDEKVVEAFIAALSNNKATDEENSQAAYQINNDEDQQVH